MKKKRLKRLMKQQNKLIKLLTVLIEQALAVDALPYTNSEPLEEL